MNRRLASLADLVPLDRSCPGSVVDKAAATILAAVPPTGKVVLPARPELAGRLGLGCTAVNQAVLRLKTAGFAYEEPGRGTVVQKRRAAKGASARLRRVGWRDRSDFAGARERLAEALAVSRSVLGGADIAAGHRARRMAYWLGHERLRLSYQAVGAAFGRDQTTVREAVQKFGAELAGDEWLAGKVEEAMVVLADSNGPAPLRPRLARRAGSMKRLAQGGSGAPIGVVRDRRPRAVLRLGTLGELASCKVLSLLERAEEAVAPGRAGDLGGKNGWHWLWLLLDAEMRPYGVAEAWATARFAKDNKAPARPFFLLERLDRFDIGLRATTFSTQVRQLPASSALRGEAMVLAGAGYALGGKQVLYLEMTFGPGADIAFSLN